MTLDSGLLFWATLY